MLGEHSCYGFVSRFTLSSKKPGLRHEEARGVEIFVARFDEIKDLRVLEVCEARAWKRSHVEARESG